MGCDGVGKSAWKRANYDSLPDRYFGQDSFAGGIGGWNSPDARARTRTYVDAQITEAIDRQLDFHMGRTYSGLPGPALVDPVTNAGYRTEAVHIGTEDPSINVERIRFRVFARTGHEVDATRLTTRWKNAMTNLRKTAERFDLLRILDNSQHGEMPAVATAVRWLQRALRADRASRAGRRPEPLGPTSRNAGTEESVLTGAPGRGARHAVQGIARVLQRETDDRLNAPDPWSCRPLSWAASRESGTPLVGPCQELRCGGPLDAPISVRQALQISPAASGWSAGPLATGLVLSPVRGPGIPRTGILHPAQPQTRCLSHSQRPLRS